VHIQQRALVVVVAVVQHNSLGYKLEHRQQHMLLHMGLHYVFQFQFLVPNCCLLASSIR